MNGPQGTLSRRLRPEIKIRQEENALYAEPTQYDARTRSFWGLTRQLIANMVQGVHEGFSRTLELHGVGYRATMHGNTLVLEVGYSHPIEVTPPEGITFSVEGNTITVSGIDKEVVGNVAAKVRQARPPEPYKGKGIRYAGEEVRRKAGKKAVGAE